MRFLQYILFSLGFIIGLPSFGLLAQDEPEPDVVIMKRGSALEFSPDGKTLAIGEVHALLYDAETGDSLQQLFPSPTNLFYSLSWSPDGERLVSTSSVSEAFVWDTKTGDLLFQLGGDTVQHLYSSAWSKDGSMIATSDLDSIVRVWSASTGALLYKKSIETQARDLSFISNDSRLFATGINGKFIIWNIQTDEVEQEVLVDKEAAGFSNVFGAINSDETIIATSSADAFFTGEIKLWDAETGDSIGLLEGHSRYALDIEFSADGSYLLSAGADSTARIWRMSDRRLVLTLRNHQSQIVDASLSQDGRKVATMTSRDSVVRVWHLNLSSAPSDPVAGESHIQVLHLHPNPATEQTIVDFQLPRSGRVQLRLVNQLGQEVESLQEQFFEAGRHQLSLNVGSLPSGSYFSLLEADGHIIVNELNIIH